jgi:archaellum component FlaC
MNNASLNQIVNKLLAFGHGHKYIKTVAHGQLDEMDLTSRVTYPLMHIVPQDITPSSGRLQFSFDIVFADMPRIKSDKPENVLEIQSDMEQIARDLYTEIKNGGVLFGDMTEVGDDWSALPFQDEYHNYLSGVTLSINIIVASNWNACEIPADWVNGTSADIPQFGRDLTIAVYEDGVFRVNAREVNFIGDGVNVEADGNRANVTVTGGGGGLTCENLPECQTIIDIEENIEAVEESISNLITAVEGLSTEVSTLTTEVTGINNSVIEISEELDVVGNNLATLTTEVAGKLDSVTGNIVDNTNPLNPVVNQVQADWNENDSNAASFIQNKPTIPDVPITIGVVLSGSSVTTTSNSLVDITGLTVALPANTSWLIESRLGVACNGTGGVRFGYSAPVDSSGNMYVEGVATSMAIYQQALSVNGALSGTAVQRFNGSSRANVTGRIDMGATGGNFTLQFASGTSGQLSTIGTGTGSYLKLTKI